MDQKIIAHSSGQVTGLMIIYLLRQYLLHSSGKPGSLLFCLFLHQASSRSNRSFVTAGGT